MWYILNDNIESCYFDFVSSYISHNDVFYVKCYAILIEELKTLIDYDIVRIINVTDGGNHFVSRFAFWYLNLFNHSYGNFKFYKFYLYFKGIIFEQWICPPHYGKGECDSHGSVIKRKTRVFLLLGKYLYDNNIII